MIYICDKEDDTEPLPAKSRQQISQIKRCGMIIDGSEADAYETAGL